MIFSSHSPYCRLVFAVLMVVSWLAGAAVSHAQIQVDLKLKRHSYILYEPLVATVTVTNNAGRDITLSDDTGKQWFNIEVNHLGGSMIPPYDPDYKLHPLTVPAGKSLQRQIDITPLFPIREQGTHRARANIYFADLDRYFYSNFVTFDLTDGKVLWRQSVGVPGSDEVRQVSLLTEQLIDRMLLYVRVKDESGTNVYTTQALGRLILTGHEPQEMFDRSNTLHVIQEAIPGTYLYSTVSIEGERLDQKAYVRLGTSRPILVKNENGDVGIRGGQVQAAPAEGVGPAGRDGGPKLSDRPKDLPVPGQH